MHDTTSIFSLLALGFGIAHTIYTYHTEIVELRNALTEQGIQLKSGQQLEVDVVILATGWRTDYSFLNGDVIAVRSLSTAPGTVAQALERPFESA